MTRPETIPAEERTPAPGATRTVRALRTVVVALLVGGIVVASAASGNIAAVLVVVGLLGVIGGGVALLRGSSEVFTIRSRGGALAVLAASVAGLTLGGAAFGAPAAPRGASVAASAAMTTTSKAAAAPTALHVLATLTVKGRAPKTGYARTADFGPAWSDVDRNGCDTRDDVLRRDLIDVRGTRCTVRSGVLHDPYTGRTIHFVRGAGTSTAVQIDHLVALSDAWQTGAQRLTKAQRVDLANDPINLLAVDGPTNESKGDGDTATWLPKQKAFRCTYVAHQVGVKHAYGLWVTKAEAAAMRRVLDTCPTMRAPVSSLVHGVAAATSSPRATATAATTAPAAAAGTGSSTAGAVRGGAYCSSAGATARTAKGTAVVCRTSSTDARLRWRHA